MQILQINISDTDFSLFYLNKAQTKIMTSVLLVQTYAIAHCRNALLALTFTEYIWATFTFLLVVTMSETACRI